MFWLLAIVFTLGGATLALAVFQAARWLHGNHAGGEAQTLGTSIIVRLGTLHALILALIFAQEIANHRDVERLVTEEAGRVADVYYGIKRYGGALEHLAPTVSESVARYVDTVLHTEWVSLPDSGLSPEAWHLYSVVENKLLRLPATNRIEVDLRQRMLEDWDAVSEYRRAREAAAERTIPGFFWVLVVSGFVLMVVPYGAFSANAVNRLNVGVLGAFNGLVLFAIVELSSLFSGSMAIAPSPLENLFSEDMQQELAQKPKS